MIIMITIAKDYGRFTSAKSQKLLNENMRYSRNQYSEMLTNGYSKIPIPSGNPMDEKISRMLRDEHFNNSIILKKLNINEKLLLEPVGDAMGQLNETLNNIRQVSQRIGKIVLNQEQVLTIKQEIIGTKSQVMDILNKKNAYGYIFSGGELATEEKPFTEDNNGNLKYHGIELYKLSNNMVEQANTLSAQTHKIETLPFKVSGMSFDIAAIGAQICGHAKFNYANNTDVAADNNVPGGDIISGDCVSVTNRIISLLDDLANNINNNDQANEIKNKINNCTEKLGTIIKNCLQVFEVRNASLRKSFDSIKESIEDSMGATGDLLAERDTYDQYDYNYKLAKAVNNKLGAKNIYQIHTKLECDSLSLMNYIVNI